MRMRVGIGERDRSGVYGTLRDQRRIKKRAAKVMRESYIRRDD